MLRQIKQGVKTLEVRVGYQNIREIKVGDLIHLMSSDDDCRVRVKHVRVYPNIYPPAKERLGIYVFEIEVVRGVR